MPTPNTIVNWNETTPAKTAGYQNGIFQTDGGSPLEKRTVEYSAPYKVIYAQPGAPLFLSTIILISFDEAVTFAANFAAVGTSSGATGFCGTHPAGSFTYTFKKNSSGTVTTIGTLVVSTGGVLTFASTGGLAQSFLVNDVLEITVGSVDPNILDVTMTLPGYRS